MQLSELDRRSQPFLGLYVMLTLPTLSLFLHFGKGQMHLFVNRFHHPFADLLFRQATHLGDPLFLAFIAVTLLLTDWRKSLLLIIFLGLCGGLVGLIKALLMMICVHSNSFNTLMLLYTL